MTGERLAEVREGLPGWRERLEQRDVNDHAALLSRVETEHGREAKAIAKAGGLREEATTREALPIVQKVSEAKERSDAIQLARAQQAQARAEAARQAEAYREASYSYQPPAPEQSHGRSL